MSASSTAEQPRSTANPTNCASTELRVVAEACRTTMERWQDAGADRLYLQVLDLGDLDHLDLIASMASIVWLIAQHVGR